MNRFDDFFDNLANIEIEDTNNILSDYIDDDNLIFIIEENREYFRNIPFDKLEDELFSFIRLIVNTQQEKNRLHDKPNNDRPISMINKDLKIIKEYQEFIINKFGAYKNHKEYLLIGNAPKEIKELITINSKLIDDLENKRFNLFCKSRYYKTARKTNLKNYLKKLRLKYKLKGVTKIEKKMIDELIFD